MKYSMVDACARIVEFDAATCTGEILEEVTDRMTY